MLNFKIVYMMRDTENTAMVRAKTNIEAIKEVYNTLPYRDRCLFKLINISCKM